ncbi:DUF7285 family protein [Halobellus ordinarius]|uniref:DUF7285 family protein n=1 Tax=Halobellus ordinarius TaxID=3075120 RepID=UPI0028801EDA|nr:hypothetical protein [Halobellus sp. ZY16]
MRETAPRGLCRSSRAFSTCSRAQTTPIVALIALLAVCTGVSLYATSLGAVVPTGTDNALAEPTLDRVYDAVSEGGVVSPVGLSRAETVAPDGHHLAVVVTTPDGRWTNGRVPPAGGGSTETAVDTADRPVSVAVGDGSVVWGRLRVYVWR